MKAVLVTTSRTESKYDESWTGWAAKNTVGGGNRGVTGIGVGIVEGSSLYSRINNPRRPTMYSFVP